MLPRRLSTPSTFYALTRHVRRSGALAAHRLSNSSAPPPPTSLLHPGRDSACGVVDDASVGHQDIQPAVTLQGTVHQHTHLCLVADVGGAGAGAAALRLGAALAVHHRRAVAHRAATGRPMPVPPPVTTATCPPGPLAWETPSPTYRLTADNGLPLLRRFALALGHRPSQRFRGSGTTAGLRPLTDSISDYPGCAYESLEKAVPIPPILYNWFSHQQFQKSIGHLERLRFGMRDSLAILCRNLFECIHKIVIQQNVVGVFEAKSELTKRFQESKIPFAVCPERSQKEPESTNFWCSRFRFL